MSIGEDQAICRRQARNAVGTAALALAQFVGSLAIGGALFGNRLIISGGRSSTAMAEEYYLANLLGILEIIDSTLHIEGYEFPVYKRFIVIESGVHAEDHQASL
jgi:hypothetical protein